MRSLKEYGELISEATPAQLADILVYLTVDYAEVCDLLIPVERAKMNFWLEHKNLQGSKPVSDTTLNMMWMAETDEKLNGLLQTRMEMYKRALEKIMSNCKAILRQKEAEARNQL